MGVLLARQVDTWKEVLFGRPVANCQGFHLASYVATCLLWRTTWQLATCPPWSLFQEANYLLRRPPQQAGPAEESSPAGRSCWGGLLDREVATCRGALLSRQAGSYLPRRAPWQAGR
jgi:hypothetical protein